MHARVYLTVLVVAILALPAIVIGESDPAHEQIPQSGQATAVALSPLARINEIKAPLLTLPAFVKAGGSFAAELDVPATTVVTGARLATADDSVVCLLSGTSHGSNVTRAWADVPSLVVRHVTFTLGACPPGLYDFIVEFEDHALPLPRLSSDFQPFAVNVMETARYDGLANGTLQPRFVVIADPQVGDPRAFQDGFEDSIKKQSHKPFFQKADAVVGDGTSGEAGVWKAIQQAFKQIRGENPDFILVAGDLGFGQLVPGSYAAEYEEIYRLLLTAEVPIFTSMGNHDGYVTNGVDGYEYWRAYLGPLYYYTQTVPGTSLLNLNTYDWSEMDRIGISLGVSAWGGQVRETQMAWVADTLADARNATPNERILSLAHHSPSWKQDGYFEYDPTGFTEEADGYPVVEQLSRGIVTVAYTDQGWSGRGRLELRDLLRQYEVEVHFAGHTHIDRVARDDGAGQIVDTHHDAIGQAGSLPPGYDPKKLHYWTRADSEITTLNQTELKDLVRRGDGPFYVETTTVMSGTKQWFGYRPVEIAYDGEGDLVLENFGVPMSQSYINAKARRPDLFNADHAELGLFSKPLVFPADGIFKPLAN